MENGANLNKAKGGGAISAPYFRGRTVYFHVKRFTKRGILFRNYH